MNNDWNVTYEIVTPESAECGDAEERGFIGQDLDFETAVCYFGYGLIESSDSDVKRARWFTITDESNCTDGNSESRSIHIPDRVSPTARIKLYHWLKNRR